MIKRLNYRAYVNVTTKMLMMNAREITYLASKEREVQGKYPSHQSIIEVFLNIFPLLI